MSMVLDSVQISEQRRQVQCLVEGIADTPIAVHWRYSAHSNDRFPLRAYASAVREAGPDADELLVIAVTWRRPRDGGHKLVIGASILDGDGGIMAEGPKFEVEIRDESLVRTNGHHVSPSGAEQIDEAMRQLGIWLAGQSTTIQRVLNASIG